MSNLKRRPFLVVNLLRKPADGSHTHVKDFGKSDNWVILENISIEDRIKDKHWLEASVIIDILKASVIKNRLEHSDEEIMKYFVKKYNKEITEGISIWMQKNNKNLTPDTIENIEKNIDKPNIIEEELSKG